MCRAPFAVFALLGLLPLSVQAAPSFDCSRVADASIEQLICQTSELAELDQQLAEVYRQASAKAANQQPPMLKAEQRGWIKGRNECWKDAERGQCVGDSYRLRIAELQARYALIEGKGPMFYVCDDQPAKEVVATFYPSEPATALVEFGDRTSLMYRQPSASGSRYQGRNESLWQRQGEIRVIWGYQAPEMVCTLRRP